MLVDTDLAVAKSPHKGQVFSCAAQVEMHLLHQQTSQQIVVGCLEKVHGGGIDLMRRMIQLNTQKSIPVPHVEEVCWLASVQNGHEFAISASTVFVFSGAWRQIISLSRQVLTVSISSRHAPHLQVKLCTELPNI